MHGAGAIGEPAQHHPQLEHQFETLDQQRESASLGMWLFLVQEVMFFGGLFLGYTVYRNMHPEAWSLGSQQLDITLGAINTVVLLASSLTMALAVRAAQQGKKNGILVNLALTTIFGLTFLVIKAFEYSHKFHDGLVPGSAFSPNPALGAPPQLELFFSFYFVMTATHAIHMVIGAGIIAVVAWMATKGKFTPVRHAAVENLGLYWHFVDVVWIFLFPLLYLLGRT